MRRMATEKTVIATTNPATRRIAPTERGVPSSDTRMFWVPQLNREIVRRSTIKHRGFILYAYRAALYLTWIAFLTLLLRKWTLTWPDWTGSNILKGEGSGSRRPSLQHVACVRTFYPIWSLYNCLLSEKKGLYKLWYRYDADF